MAENLIQKILESVTPEIYERFKSAIEIRRWPNGVKLTGEQMDTCMQAVVAYEYQNIPETERTGYVPPKKEACEDAPLAAKNPLEETAITWR